MENLNRRSFLRTTLALGTGATISTTFPSCSSTQAYGNTSADNKIFKNYWIHIPKQGNITFICSRSEMGQGISTGFASLLCESLDYPIENLNVENAPANTVYDHKQYMVQGTGGSSSISTEYQHILNIGASIRGALIKTASKKFNLNPIDISTKDGFLIIKGKKHSYQSLAEELTKSSFSEIEFDLKKQKNFKYIGKKVLRVDNKKKIRGEEAFGIDTKDFKKTGIENPLVAVVIHSPVLGGKPLSCNKEDLLEMTGVKFVEKISTGFAIVAEKYWQADKAKKAFVGKWENPKEKFNSKTFEKDCLKKVQTYEGKELGSEGEDYKKLEYEIDAEYSVPFLAHATLEPQNCTVDIKEDAAHVWVPTQSPGNIKSIVSEITGINEDKITTTSASLGGGFGRRGAMDYLIQATEIGYKVKKPVKLQFSREDDMAAGYYRPLAVTKMKASFDSKGKEIYLKQSIATQSIAEAIIPDAMPAVTPSWFSPGVSRAIGRVALFFADGMTVKEGVTIPYNFSGFDVSWQKMESPVIPLFWRSVGHTQNAFFAESFVDEIANKLNVDPMKFREERLVNNPRQLGVLKKVKEMSGWDKKGNRHFGVASHYSFKSWAAAVVEVENVDGAIKVKNVWCAIDCGRAINPDSIHAQMMGSSIFGLTAAMYGKIEYEDGQVVQSNFHDYPLLSMAQTPNIETQIIESLEDPTGVGEPGVPVMAPALANAIFSLSKKRHRRLPLSDEVQFI